MGATRAVGEIRARLVSAVSHGPVQLLVPNIDRLPSRAASRSVALTIDDGPCPASTPAILAALAAHEARASFFCSGVRAEAHPELVRAMVDAGHEVYPHGYEHEHFDRLTRGAVVEALERTESLLRAARPTPTPYFVRLPHAAGQGSWHVNRAVLGWNHDAVFARWNVSSDDWAIDGTTDVQAACATAVDAVLSHTTLEGSIVLLHDSPIDATHDAGPLVARTLVPALVDALVARGFRLVGLGEAWSRP